MKQHPPDPRRLDVAAAAAAALQLEGRWPVAGFERLADGMPQDTDVAWSVRGQLRPVPGAEAEVWLHLVARARVWRDCQRFLQPVALELELSRPLRFVADEATAAALDAESEDDVLVASRSLDLHELVEDELLLALPLVPMHDRCPRPLPMAAGDAATEPAPNPFAALAVLKRGPTG
jgi:uncharacterized protein